MKAIEQLINYFEARGRLNARQVEEFLARGYGSRYTGADLPSLEKQVGQSFYFQATGANNGRLWGTDVYTSDSDLAVASVHAGVLRPGESGVVRVTIVPPLPVFQGSTRNGVTSSAFGPYPGAYRVARWSPGQP